MKLAATERTGNAVNFMIDGAGRGGAGRVPVVRGR